MTVGKLASGMGFDRNDEVQGSASNVGAGRQPESFSIASRLDSVANRPVEVTSTSDSQPTLNAINAPRATSRPAPELTKAVTTAQGREVMALVED